MAITPAQKTAIEEVIAAILAVSVGNGRGRRQLSGMFMNLVDKEDYPEYYDVGCYARRDIRLLI
jgi:chromatin structure-remodeling complex subunit RSC1/2